jgi:hypothetical protein
MPYRRRNAQLRTLLAPDQTQTDAKHVRVGSSRYPQAGSLTVRSHFGHSGRSRAPAHLLPVKLCALRRIRQRLVRHLALHEALLGVGLHSGTFKNLAVTRHCQAGLRVRHTALPGGSKSSHRLCHMTTLWRRYHSTLLPARLCPRPAASRLGSCQGRSCGPVRASAHRFVHVRVQLQRALLERALDLHQVRVARDPQYVVRRARRRRRAGLPPPLARPPPRGALSQGRRPKATPGRVPVVRRARRHASGQRRRGGGTPRPAWACRRAPSTPGHRPVVPAYQWCAPAHKQGLSLQAWP